MASGDSWRSRFSFTLALCFALSVIEGFDLQSAGVAAPLMAPAFGLDPQAMGWVFGAAIIGLTMGAVVGGSLSDRYGRKALLVASLCLFGTFSLLTAAAADIPTLIAMRFLTGLGLGGAFPVLIAIVAEESPEHKRSASVATVYAGMPVGGASAAALSFFGSGDEWTTIFIVGGSIPLALLHPTLFWRPRGPRSGETRRTTAAVGELFAPVRLKTTLFLWGASFAALVVLYLLLNWLPSLLVARGIDRERALAIQILFNLGGAISARYCGVSLDRFDNRKVATIAGVVAVSSLPLLAIASGNGLFLAAAASGAGVMAIQSIVYATAPRSYPAHIRGLGVGAVISVGRVGSIIGPLLAGILFAAGMDGVRLLIALIPVAMISAWACRRITTNAAD